MDTMHGTSSDQVSYPASDQLGKQTASSLNEILVY
jgi:hypothetical protein